MSVELWSRSELEWDTQAWNNEGRVLATGARPSSQQKKTLIFRPLLASCLSNVGRRRDRDAVVKHKRQLTSAIPNDHDQSSMGLRDRGNKIPVTRNPRRGRGVGSRASHHMVVLAPFNALTKAK